MRPIAASMEQQEIP